jgi:hypothetical protein
MPLDLNEEIVQAGTVASLTTPGDFDVDVVVKEASIVKGVVVHTVDLTDAVDVFSIEVNGAATSPVTVCNGTNGVAANRGEFIGASRRLEVSPGDRITVVNGGQSTGVAAAFAAVVLVR